LQWLAAHRKTIAAVLLPTTNHAHVYTQKTHISRAKRGSTGLTSSCAIANRQRQEAGELANDVRAIKIVPSR